MQYVQSVGGEGKPVNKLFERFANAMKRKFNSVVFSKNVKNDQKNEERRRLGFTRIEYQAF